MQGGVEVRRSSSAAWQEVGLNDAICPGDTVRVGTRSRAALLLSNETTVRLDQNTTLTVAAEEKDQGPLLNLVRGVINVISRTPHRFPVKTPYLNATIRGTEFMVAVSDESGRVAVYEGLVTADNERGSVDVAAGEEAVAAKDSAPRAEVMVRPQDAVQWTLYVPTIFDYGAAAAARASAGSALGESIELYRKGSVADAIEKLEGVPEAQASPQLAVYRAELLLLVGRLDEARPDIERALALDSHNSDAYALQAMVAVVQNDKEGAARLAGKAVDLNPASPPARVALSYAQQAQFHVEQALATVQKAVDLDSQNALLWARLAELKMSTGNLDGALDAAKQAAALNPDLSKTQSVLGFADLARIDTKAAKQAFQKAIELDSADPLARLGLGLAKVRDGDLKGGREEIEIATALDPGRSLIRSYLGKAYYEEKRDKPAGVQFGQAKELDRFDPTPWYYDAIRKQTENRPVEALQDLEKSIDLNEDRAVYRSQLLLDQDQAARRVNQARIYRDLGFDQLALVEAYRSLALDPGSDSAHRFLADAYSDVERGDITRVSESLQAQLRQPVSIPATDLLLSTDNLFILRDTGLFRLGTNEFDQLFDRDQVRFQIDGVGGTHQTSGDQAVISGLIDGVGYAVSQLHFASNGFRDNSNTQRDVYDAFLQAQISPDSTAQLDLKRSRLELGETFNSFDPVPFPAQIKDDSSSVRFGGHVIFGLRDDFIWSAIYEDRHTFQEAASGAFVVDDDTARTYTTEIQLLHRFGRSYLVAGAGFLSSNDEFVYGFNVKSTSSSVYAYGHWTSSGYDLSLDAGMAAESVNSDYSLDNSAIRRHRLSPKLGLTWSPAAGTTVRAAAFSSVRRTLIGSQTIEPTQIAGFNQFFAGFNALYGDEDATESQRACLAVDQKLSMTAYAGAEVTGRRLRVPAVDTDYDWREKTARVYAYKAYGPFPESSILAAWQAAVSFEAQFEQIDRPEAQPGPEGILDVKTVRVPLGVRVFNGNGFAVGASTSYIKQTGLFFDGNMGAAEVPKREIAWVTDLFVDYRLPRRLGVLSVGAKNLFNRSIDVFDADPAFPVVPAQRFLYARVRLSF